MKKIALSLAALAVTAGSALAADLPSRKGPPVLPPPPPPPPLWTGFYVGLNAGGGWANSTAIQTVGGPLAVASPLVNPAGFVPLANAFAIAGSSYSTGGSNGGFIGGGQIGYNFQFYNNFVVGIEADIQGIAGSSSNSAPSFSAAPVIGFPGEVVSGATVSRRNLDYIGTVRGRLGWLATPTLLLYGTGGLAYGGVSMNTAWVGVEAPTFGAFPGFGATAFSDTRVGWTAGGGVEWMFWPNWSAKVEYLYYDLGNVTANGTATIAAPAALIAATALQSTTHFNGNIVRAGVNYHFNWGAPAPVVAKY
ncbi:outer membrane protein [Methylocystis parvus]|uniref:Porin family protein n=1 Tax=Methylocystis parvus TaxID=134 RepID=A0A6B8M9S5_9HYPH|nr:outer membrane beta-barrel protein [Methylocystis parvus]QGM99165.1 porin family protein [Methylocystis parvus]WBK00461.1 outer membrane beta-barrel protein [Methylocystis parvus OBBP]